MLPDRVSNPGPLTYESGALLIALRGPALAVIISSVMLLVNIIVMSSITSIFMLTLLHQIELV